MNGSLLIACLVSLSFMVSACSEEADCFVADSIEGINTADLGDAGYFLYLRTSGFHEKSRSYELFREKPQFDICGQTTSQAVFQVLVDDAEGIPRKLEISGDDMRIVYASHAENGIDFGSIQVEIIKPPVKASN